MSVNKVILIGRLGKDPEIRNLKEDSKVANAVLATSEKFKKQTGEVEEVTEWHNLIFWNKSADIAEKLLIKGTQLYIEGKLTTRKWEDKDGVTRYTTSIKVEEFKILSGGKPKENHGSASISANLPATTGAAGTECNSQPDDDLPF